MIACRAATAFGTAGLILLVGLPIAAQLGTEATSARAGSVSGPSPHPSSSARALRARSIAGAQLWCPDCHAVPPSTGAHGAHADLNGYTRGFDCSLCHFVRRFPDRHDNGTVEVRFSELVGSGARYSAGTCSDIRCHSDGLGQFRTVAWTGSIDLGCTGCHDDRTSRPIEMSGRHEFHLNSGIECSACHAGVVDLADQLVSHDRHADGNPDVSVLAGTYDTTTGACTPGCHVTRNWSDDR